MSDENIKANRGRWDHLLREIPTQNLRQPETKRSIQKEIEPPPPPPETLVIEDAQEEDVAEEVFSVADINKAIKKQLEGQFSFIWVRGEISNFKAHSSGHYYFSLKDEKAQINAVMFKGFNSRLRFRPESGMEVLVRGKITVYEPRGNYQVFCESMEPVGAGALQKAFEQLKDKLSKEGLFSQEHKQAIPAFPKEVGVVTSPTGAAIQDILNVLGRRSKRVNVTVIPARVQGDGAAAEVVRGIQQANQLKIFDVLIVGRGGGSIEDLWCFNEEIVARAIFESKIPIISAVGHEIDFTIADFVGDLRAPTPSAAAEVVAKSEQELQEKIQFYSRSLRIQMYRQIEVLRNQTQQCAKSLMDPRKYVRDSIMRLDDWSQRLIHSLQRHIKTLKLQNHSLRKALVSPKQILQVQEQKNKNLHGLLLRAFRQKLNESAAQLGRSTSLLDSLSPLRTVDRGYAIVRQEGRLVPDVKNLKKDLIDIELRDGVVSAQVKNIVKKEES